MEFHIPASLIGSTFINTPELVLLVDWLLKSMLIALSTGLLIAIFSRRLASGSKHLLLLNIYICIALLPLIDLMNISSSTVSEFVPVLFSLDARPSPDYSLTSYPDDAMYPGNLLLFAYLIPTAFLIFRLIISGVFSWQIGHRARKVEDKEHRSRLAELRTQLNIKRPVQLLYSDEISSPLSFGIINPLILLPDSARDWKPELLDDVLIHELSHIKRLDWLTMVFAYLVASLLWMNALLWIALRKLNEEAENCCDTSVLQQGQSETDYAEHLLCIARDMQGKPRKHLLAQMMLDKSLLPKRIHRLLENDMVNVRTHKLFAAPLLLLTSILLVTCTNGRLMEVEHFARPAPTANPSPRTEILPETAVAPQYPLRAAYEGIEGWTLAEFTVLANGGVDPESVVVVDAEPSYVFDRASIRAAKRFKFEPLANIGVSEIPGVQYVFRFELGEPRNGVGSINRELKPVNSVTPDFPSQAESAGIAGGSVWTVFHVTRAGAVQDVAVNYSSNDAFNESAIAAAQQLQFATRVPGDGIAGNVRGDTSGLVKAQYLFRFASEN